MLVLRPRGVFGIGATAIEAARGATRRALMRTAPEVAESMIPIKASPIDREVGRAGRMDVAYCVCCMVYDAVNGWATKIILTDVDYFWVGGRRSALNVRLATAEIGRLGR